MQLKCTRFEIKREENGVGEAVADLWLADYGLVLRNVAVIGDAKLGGGSLVLPQSAFVVDGKPVFVDVLTFATEYDRVAFTALAIKAIIEFVEERREGAA